MSKTAHRDSGKIRVITGPSEGEPLPIWRKAPHYGPDEDFPPYRHVPGVTPHPERNEAGHSYRRKARQNMALTAENWARHDDYLRGIDLYHNGYLWEAHEAWEGPWKEADPDSLEANLLQALILNSAAQLKIHLGNAEGARKHSLAARWRLARIRTKGYDGSGATFLGVDIGDLIEQMKKHYDLLWESESSEEIRVRGRGPKLKLDGLA